MDDIKSLFQQRDNAVVKKDRKLFASTQIQEIVNASIDGYLSSSNLVTEVFYVADDSDLKKVAFVKESYGTHSAFLLYHLINTAQGWKIYDVISHLR